MSPFSTPPRPMDSRSVLEWVDAVADRFEVEWRSGQPPRIEDYLEGTVGEKRLLLLHELTKIDLERRQKAGQKQRWEDYLTEFPELQNAQKAAVSIFFAAADTNLASSKSKLDASEKP